MNERSHTSATLRATSTETCAAAGSDARAVARVGAALAGESRVERTLAIFSALSDRTRFRILNALALEELCVCDLAAISGVSQSGVSHQLRLLRDRGLVAFKRDANRVVYRLADEHVRTLLKQGLEHAAEQERVR